MAASEVAWGGGGVVERRAGAEQGHAGLGCAGGCPRQRRRAPRCVENVQFFVACCGAGVQHDLAAWLGNNTGVPPSCCRPDSELPYIYHDLKVYQLAHGMEWRRELPRVLHVRSCPAGALRWLRERSKHFLAVVVLVVVQLVLVAGAALSALWTTPRATQTLWHLPPPRPCYTPSNTLSSCHSSNQGS